MCVYEKEIERERFGGAGGEVSSKETFYPSLANHVI